MSGRLLFRIALCAQPDVTTDEIIFHLTSLPSTYIFFEYVTLFKAEFNVHHQILREMQSEGGSSMVLLLVESPGAV